MKSPDSKKRKCQNCGVKYMRPWFDNPEFEKRTLIFAIWCTLCDKCLAKSTVTPGYSSIRVAECTLCHLDFAYRQHGDASAPTFWRPCDVLYWNLHRCQRCQCRIDKADTLELAFCEACKKEAQAKVRREQGEEKERAQGHHCPGCTCFSGRSYSPPYAPPPRKREEPLPTIDPTDPKWWLWTTLTERPFTKH